MNYSLQPNGPNLQAAPWGTMLTGIAMKEDNSNSKENGGLNIKKAFKEGNLMFAYMQISMRIFSFPQYQLELR